MLPVSMNVHSKQGGYIAEAAVVLPMIMMALITVTLILLFFYEESVDRSLMHMELRNEAARVTGHLPEYIIPDSQDDSISDSLHSSDSSAAMDVSRKGIFRNVSGRVHVRMICRGLLSALPSSIIEGNWHAADGVAFKRIFK